MPKFAESLTKMGQKFGRPDIERIGVFIEMPYISAKRFPKKKVPSEGRNLLCEGPKIKDGTQYGYFDKSFKRIFSKEALAGRGRKKEKPKYRNVSERPFVPPPGPKKHSCPGDYHGCFSGNIEAFGNLRRKKPPRKPELRNILTSPAKKGNCGYIDIGLSIYPEHKPDRYGYKPKEKVFGKTLGRAMVNVHYPQPCFDKNPFREAENIKPGPTYVRPKEKPSKILPPGKIVPTGPGKWQGGCHDGCFNKFPEHMSERKKVKAVKKTENLWHPPAYAMKSYYNTSVLHQNVDFRLNAKNYKTFHPTYLKYLVEEK